MTDLPGWRRSTRCSESGCLEAALVGDQVWLRNTTKPHLGTKKYAIGVWMWILSQVEAKDDFHWFDYATGLEPTRQEYWAFRFGVGRWEFEPRVLAGSNG